MLPLASNPEVDWWNNLKNDDPQALGHLYDAYIDKLFVSAMHITADRELAKDAIQEVFIEIWNYRKTIGEVSDSRAYLATVLRRILFRKLRKNHLFVASDISGTISPDLNVEERLISVDADMENQQRLNNAISKLSKRQKLLLELSFYKSLSYEQIAAKLQLNYQSVNNLAFRTLRRLRDAMTPVLVAFFLA